MCTAISFKTKEHYFGRTLDLYYRLNERVTVTPRNFCFKMRFLSEIKNHYAFIGMATEKGGYPLYYEAVNEMGLSIAGLNFPHNACYLKPTHGKINLAPFELIPYLLCLCKDTYEAKKTIKNINLVDAPFAPDMPNTPLHFMVSDEHQSLVIEPTKNGLMVYNNPVGVLTNNPPFETQMLLLSNYTHLSNEQHKGANTFGANLTPYSLGMGALGLPGDASSASRFVRAVFTKAYSNCDDAEAASVEQFFHILKAVSVARGVTLTDAGEPQFTRYSSCINSKRGIYYYTTYLNSRINAVDMFNEDLEGMSLTSYPINKEFDINLQN